MPPLAAPETHTRALAARHEEGGGCARPFGPSANAPSLSARSARLRAERRDARGADFGVRECRCAVHPARPATDSCRKPTWPQWCTIME